MLNIKVNKGEISFQMEGSFSDILADVIYSCISILDELSDGDKEKFHSSLLTVAILLIEEAEKIKEDSLNDFVEIVELYRMLNPLMSR